MEPSDISIKLCASENGFLNMLRLMQIKGVQLAVEAELKKKKKGKTSLFFSHSLVNHSPYVCTSARTTPISTTLIHHHPYPQKTHIEKPNISNTKAINGKGTWYWTHLEPILIRNQIPLSQKWWSASDAMPFSQPLTFPKMPPSTWRLARVPISALSLSLPPDPIALLHSRRYPYLWFLP